MYAYAINCRHYGLCCFLNDGVEFDQAAYDYLLVNDVSANEITTKLVTKEELASRTDDYQIIE